MKHNKKAELLDYSPANQMPLFFPAREGNGRRDVNGIKEANPHRNHVPIHQFVPSAHLPHFFYARIAHFMQYLIVACLSRVIDNLS